MLSNHPDAERLLIWDHSWWSQVVREANAAAKGESIAPEDSAAKTSTKGKINDGDDMFDQQDGKDRESA